MLILIDNYDSFTYNIVQYLGHLGEEPRVYRNDQITVAEVMAQSPDGVIISPGPCNPDKAGICLDMIKECAEKSVPMFGVCLGMQAMGQAFGGDVIRAPEPMHGKISIVRHDGASVFKGLPSPLKATRYHSLVIDITTIPPELEITAQSEDGLIMGLAHTSLPLHGVQFHPESIATDHGHAMFKNFLDAR
jgi:anthranilate synthase component II